MTSLAALLLIAIAALALVACGNANANKGFEAKDGETAQPKTETNAAPKFESVGQITDDNYTELLKVLCGVDSVPSADLTFHTTLRSPGNATVIFKGAKAMDERVLQKVIFDRCKAVADGGTIYQLQSNAEQGIHKGDPIASFDDFKGVNWIYDFQGQQVNCYAAKNGDRFEVRFGR